MSNIQNVLRMILGIAEQLDTFKDEKITKDDLENISKIRKALDKIAGTDRMVVDRIVKSGIGRGMTNPILGQVGEEELVWRNPSYIRSAPLISVTEPLRFPSMGVRPILRKFPIDDTIDYDLEPMEFIKRNIAAIMDHDIHERIKNGFYKGVDVDGDCYPKEMDFRVGMPEDMKQSDIENKRVFECGIGNTLALMTGSKQEAEDLYMYFVYQLTDNEDYIKNNILLFKKGCEVMVSCVKECVNNFITLKLK